MDHGVRVDLLVPVWISALPVKEVQCTLDYKLPGLGKIPFYPGRGGGFCFTNEEPTFHMGFWSKTPFELGRYSLGALLHGCAPYGLGLNPNWISLFN